MKITPFSDNLSTKELKLRLNELRASIKKEVSNFTAAEGTIVTRRAKGAWDMLWFGKSYFPHYFPSAYNKMHKEVAADLQEVIKKSIDTGEGHKEVVAAPRGNAKSSIISFLFVMWCIAYGYRKFIILLSDASLLAASFVDAIQAELEENPRLQEDFPEICGEGSMWRRGEIVTKNGVKIQGFGSGKRLRGVKKGATRPDLVLGDDLENDENVESLEQRGKLKKWFDRAVMKVGHPSTIYVVAGTVLHPESLLSELLKKPGWRKRFYQSIIKFSISPLWARWKEIFCGAEDEGQEADEYYKKYEEGMLRGTEVLWPEVEPYYYLMKMLVSDGEAEFNSEKQNEPLDPKEQIFHTFHYYEGEPWRYEPGVFIGCVDPSLGKSAKKGDYSAVIVLWRANLSGKVYIVEADIERRPPDEIFTRMELFQMCYPNIAEWKVEEVAFQEFFKDVIISRSRQNQTYLPITGYRPNTDKKLRIIADQPHIHNGTILFKKEHKTLIEQYKNFRRVGGGHDDGPDGVNIGFQGFKRPGLTAGTVHTGHKRESLTSVGHQTKQMHMNVDDHEQAMEAQERMRDYASRFAGAY